MLWLHKWIIHFRILVANCWMHILKCFKKTLCESFNRFSAGWSKEIFINFLNLSFSKCDVIENINHFILQSIFIIFESYPLYFTCPYCARSKMSWCFFFNIQIELCHFDLHFSKFSFKIFPKRLQRLRWSC